MKAALTLTLTASLIASSLPAAAQFIPMPPRRYTPPSQYAPPPPPTVLSDWTHVRAIAPGSKVIVSAIGLGGQDSQYFVSATDRVLTLLALENVDLPRPARRLVIKLAATHPDLFTLPQQWTEFTDGSARANPDGVFIRGRKIADLSEITRTIDAGDVAEVARQVRVERRPGPFEAPPGEGIVALVPFLGLSFLGCHNECGRAGGVVAAIAGPIIVGAIITAKKQHYDMQVVYRAR
jgi:hypothetical protein